MVPRAHGLDDVGAQSFHFKARGEQIEVKKRADIVLGVWIAERSGVEPADKELEGAIFDIGDSESLGGGGFFVLPVEGVREKGRVVAEKLLVQNPVRGVWPDIDIDEGAREESRASVSRTSPRDLRRARQKRTHEEVFLPSPT